MADSETGLPDSIDEMDLDKMDLDVDDTGYEKDVDVEVIDGFYHQNVAFMNEKVRLYADYWMKLYSDCCLQRDYAMELLNDNKPEEAKVVLRSFPTTEGAPNVPQLLVEEPLERKRKKKSTSSIECDGAMLIKEMEDKYISGEMVHFDVPNVLPEGDVSLAEYETLIKECENCFKTVENYVIQNAFAYGAWLSKAFNKFQNDKTHGLISGNFDDWIDQRCKVKPRRARQLRKFYKLFSPYKKVLRCKLPFIWFDKNGMSVVKYFKSHPNVAMPWTHEINCTCGNCM